jgi:prepilin-type N-terminal cleavage/methylation domain-containing protein
MECLPSFVTANSDTFNLNTKIKRNMKKAFTIMELITVVAILGIIGVVGSCTISAHRQGLADQQRQVKEAETAQQKLKEKMDQQKTANALTEVFVQPETVESLRVVFNTALSKNGQIIPLGHGLYFFNKEEVEALDSVASFCRENTNLEMVATFSAKNSFGKSKWYTACNVEIQSLPFPDALFITNGMFVIFKDR